MYHGRSLTDFLPEGCEILREVDLLRKIQLPSTCELVTRRATIPDSNFSAPFLQTVRHCVLLGLLAFQ